MSDLDARLERIEQKLQVISINQSPLFGSQLSLHGDEIDLRQLFSILWQAKWLIVGITVVFAAIGVIYSLSLPNMYKSEGVYAPAQKQNGGAINGQLGGLASLAGMNLGGGENDDIYHAMALITSWPFLESVINKYDLKPLIVGVKAWDPNTGDLIWDQKVFDPVNKRWLREPPKGKESEPSSYEVYQIFNQMIAVDRDSKNGLVKVSVEYFSPTIAKNWVEILVYEINTHFRERDKNEAQKNIEYLQAKVEETSISEMHSVIYGMIESQLKTLMLAEVGDEYLLKSVVVAKAAELKSKPKRIVLVLLAAMAGGFLSVLFVFVRFFVKKNNCE